MSARLPWVELDAAGVGIPSLTVQLYRKAGDVLLGSFTDAGNGLYYIDHTISEPIYVKVGGVKQTFTDGMMFPADDVAKATDLASTATGKGASLIGIVDTGGRYSGATVEAALAEIYTAANLARTVGADDSGAYFIGVFDLGGYFANNNVESVLQEIGAITILLAGLTASAAELNKLDGTNAYVTADALNANCSTGEASLYHYHDMANLKGFAIAADGVGSTSLELWPYQSGGASGDVIARIWNLTGGADGRFLVYKKGWGISANYYEVMTAQEIGTLDWTGDPILGPLTSGGTLTQALGILSQSIQMLQQLATGIQAAAGFTRSLIARGQSQAAATDGATAASLAADAIYEKTSTSYKIKDYWYFIQYPETHYVKLYREFKVDSASTAKVRLHIPGTAITPDEQVPADTSYNKRTFTLDLKEIPVTAATGRLLTLEMAGTGSVAIYANNNFELWQELGV